MTKPASLTIRELYERLLEMYGPQKWWPAETPFEVIMGAILVQNTNWRNAAHAILNLKARYLVTPGAIESTSEEALADIIHPAGFYRVKAKRIQNVCAWIHENGELDDLNAWDTDSLRDSLLAVKGIGPETADSILCYAFGRPVFVADSYARRLFGRVGSYHEKEQGRGYEDLRAFVEAVMGKETQWLNELHALVVRHSKDICRSEPQCGRCQLESECKWAQSLQ